MSTSGYVHGYTSEEQDRLYQQARFLAPKVYERVDFSKQKKLLEVGCGVGAQTAILLERFPHLHIDGVDASASQIERAKQHLAKPVASGQVTLQVADAEKLPFADRTYDAGFICWFLEHVTKPHEILKEIHRVMQPGASIFCSEVLNATLYLHPYSPATLKYWFVFNDHQWEMGGDPFVGAKLGNLLMAAGFKDIWTFNETYHYDNRTPEKRAAFIEYWTSLLLSGAPGMIQAGKIRQEEADEMKRELAVLKVADDSVFFYSCMQARAKA